MEKRIKKRFSIAVLAAMLAGAALTAACGGTKEGAAAGAGRYEREPIREVSQEQLDEDSRLIEAVALAEAGRTDEALAAYSRLAAQRPQCAAAWYEMGRLLMRRSWTDSAAACLARATALQPQNRWYLLAQAEVQGRRGDTKGLIATRERIVGLQPDVIENYYDLSNAYVADKDYAGAVEALDRVERKIGVSEPVSMQKQRLWMAAGKEDKAVREMERLADAMPGEKRLQAIMAEMYMNQEKYAKAKRYYDRIAASDPDDEYIHIQLAEYYKRTGRPDEADREMAEAFGNPKLDCTTKLQLLGSFYTNEEFYGTRTATTFRLLDMAMESCGDNPTFALIYGDALMRQSKYAEAARWLEKSLRGDSSRYEVWEALLICLSEVPEREAEMLDYAARAERMYPMKTLPLFMQAVHLVQEQRYGEALEKLEKASRWGFNKGYLEADTYALLGECHYRTGHYDKAWQAFERSIALRPDDWGTLNNYAYYLGEQNTQLEKAEQMSRRTIEAEPQNANSLDTYAWLLHLLGRDAEALPYMRRAVELNPGSETLQRHLKEIESK